MRASLLHLCPERHILLKGFVRPDGEILICIFIHRAFIALYATSCSLQVSNLVSSEGPARRELLHSSQLPETQYED